MVPSQLLFFDTFSHESGPVGSVADINLDLVQFPRPVHITEVRVIPLGAKVKANFPGGHRMGATNPSKFDLDLFVNNLKAPGASTFETVGQLHYNQAGVISLVCRPEIATDGLVLRGLYSTITLAVYGALSDQTPEQLARQGAQEVQEAAVKVKQELPQETMSLGEAYAAEWTEQHKNQALKAEPPDDVKQWAGSSDIKDQFKTNGAGMQVKREKNGEELSPRSDRSFNRNRRSPSRDRSYERRSRDRSVDRRSRDRDNRSRDRDYRSRSRDRKYRDRSPNSYRKESPGNVSRRSLSPFNRSLRSLSPRGRSPPRDKSPRGRSPRDRDSQYSGDRSYRSLSRDRSRAGDKRKYHSSSSLNRESPVRRSKSPARDKFRDSASRGRQFSEDRPLRSSSRRRDSLSPRTKDRSRSGSGPRKSLGIKNGHSSPVNDGADQKDLFDAVSDISDGDIPGELDDDMDDVNEKEEDLANTLSSSIVKEDVEEISDDEAEWSDDFDAGCYSDMDNIEMDEDLEDPTIFFKPTDVNLAPLKSLSFLPQTKKDLSSDKTLDQILETNFEDNCDEKFIENIEQLAKVVQSELVRTKSHDIHEKLVNISLKSISFDLAMSHSKPLLKVRHLKSGLKLMVELLQCGDLMVNSLVKNKVQEELFSLLASDHMAMSLKLLILNALDLSLNSLDGFHNFRASQLYTELSSLKHQSSRIMAAVSSLFKKLRLLEQLEQLIPVLADNVEEKLDDVTDIINETREAFTQEQVGTSYWQSMAMFSVLDSLLYVLTSPATSDNEQLMASVHGVLALWMDDTRGLFHLASHPGTTTNIIRALLGYRQEEESSANNDITEDTEGPTRGYQLGCQLAYTTQCLQYLDTISHHVSLAQGDRLLMETEEVYSAVSSLYSLTFSSRGREAVTRTVSMASNVDCLLALTQHSQQSGKKDMKKSASRGFASELLLMVVRGSDNAEWLGQYAGQLMVLGSSDSHSKLSELVAWVSPAQDSAVFTQSGLDSLISVVKQRLDSGEPELDRILTCELVTAVRLLQFHVTPSLDTCPILGTRVASRSVSAAVITMFSSDLINLYTQLLDKISQDHHQPHLHTATFLGAKGFTVISVLHPVISTLRIILESVIECCDTDYKDTSVINVLLRINTLLSVVPSSSSYYHKSVETSQQLVQCLLAFTRPNVDLTKNNVGKTVWSGMVTQLLEYIVSSPAVLVPGLSLLSQLLPLPLPLPSTRPLSEQELSAVSTARKLWSVHLHPTLPQVSSLVGVMATHTHPTVVNIINRLTDQLASLSPLIAGMLVTSLVSRAAVDMESALETHEQCQPIRARMLSYLEWCMSTQPTINTLTCHTMDKDPVFSSDLVSVLRSGLSSISDKCQASAVNIVTSLCDPGISIASEQGGDNSDQHLADSLPGRDSIVQLLSCLLDCMTLDSMTFSTLTQILNTLSTLTKTQYLLSIVRTSLVSDSKTRPLSDLLRRLAVQFSTEDPSLVSCLTSLMALVTSLQLCNNGLSLEEAGDVLGWLDKNVPESEVAERRRTHPLLVIANRINSSEPDLALADISRKMSELVTKLESLPSDATVSYQDNVVPLGCEARTPLELWTARKVVIESEDISSDQLSMSFWLQQSDVTTSDNADQATVPCDLLSVAGRYLPGLELLEAAKEVTKERSLGMVRKKKGSKKSYMETKALLNKNIISAFRDGKNVNLRGRGFARTAFKSDQFRTRPPNTSRPPSLHVDDFLLLEMAGHQPTGPTGYNKQSVKAAKELFAQREAEAALKPPPVLREATREPVGLTRSRGRGDNRSSSRGGGDRSFRGSNGSNGRSFRRGWSPSNEPRDLGREARPRRQGGSGGRGAPRGGRHRQ